MKSACPSVLMKPIRRRPVAESVPDHMPAAVAVVLIGVMGAGVMGVGVMGVGVMGVGVMGVGVVGVGVVGVVGVVVVDEVRSTHTLSPWQSHPAAHNTRSARLSPWSARTFARSHIPIE